MSGGSGSPAWSWSLPTSHQHLLPSDSGFFENTAVGRAYSSTIFVWRSHFLGQNQIRSVFQYRVILPQGCASVHLLPGLLNQLGNLEELLVRDVAEVPWHHCTNIMFQLQWVTLSFTHKSSWVILGEFQTTWHNFFCWPLCSTHKTSNWGQIQYTLYISGPTFEFEILLRFPGDDILGTLFERGSPQKPWSENGDCWSIKSSTLRGNFDWTKKV